MLRPYPPDQIFSLTGPLITGSVADGWEPTLANWIRRSATSPFRRSPNLAAAYFLRGWGDYLQMPQTPLRGKTWSARHNSIPTSRSTLKVMYT